MTIIFSLLVILLTFYILSEVVDKYFIKSLDNIADWLKLTPSVAGATLLAFGTSAPEISTALFTLFLPNSNPATGVGTIVGSAIFQILVVVGFAALVKTSYLDWKPVVRDSVYYAFSVGLLIWFINDGIFELWEAASLVGAYFVYLILLYFWSQYVPENESDVHDYVEDDPEHPPTGIFKTLKIITKPVDMLLGLIPDASKKPQTTIPVFILSLGIIGVTCYFMVLAAEDFAGALGIPTSIVALTILAGGSSVPELISSAIVSKQGRGDMAIANAIGSNVFDILMSLGLPMLIFTAMNGPVGNLGGANITSSIILLFVTLIAVILLLAAQKFKAGRVFGAILIGVYVLYVIAAYMEWIGG